MPDNGLLFSRPVCESTPAVAPRPRGACLARRIGQSGNVYQPAHPGKWNPGAPCYGRFWVDIPGTARQRRTVAIGVCATKTIARKRLRSHIEEFGVNDASAFRQNTAPATTFAQQAEHWLAGNPHPSPQTSQTRHARGLAALPNSSVKRVWPTWGTPPSRL
jgi:hypothetical protein